ncbi:hypothetical protein CANARDRAFT_177151 [[Candida] arabinofermentans NRRL YB-2248]|uniref:Uncharacterized protein n=1 Tax=[Candida] arabinofermentans NRRL YB-2248 TaxID=983967 RepID=A0A1E4SWT5_9ASCO|nr:hypothetical protein CANARDRAFT_177151 [[Candida] arabinofermentans NRRL YB-2248]
MVRISKNAILVSTSSKELFFYIGKDETPYIKTSLPFEILQFLTFGKSDSIICHNPNCSFMINVTGDGEYVFLVSKLPFTVNTTSIKRLVSNQLVALSNSKLSVINHETALQYQNLHIKGEIQYLKFVKGRTADYLICNNSNKLMIIESLIFSHVDEMEIKHLEDLKIIRLPTPNRIDKSDSDFGILVLATDESTDTPISGFKAQSLCVIGIGRAGKFVELTSKVTSERRFPR